MEKIQETQANIMSMFQQRMAQFESDLKHTTSQSSSSDSYSNLSKEFSYFKTFVMEALGNLQQQIELLALNLDRMEMHSRRKILLVHGIPENKEDLAKTVTKVLQDSLKIKDFCTDDIRRCQRMGQQRSSKNPRPILLKFNDMAARNNVWYSKTNLKGTGITISEFLTKYRHDIFVAARQKFGLGKAWTRHGLVRVIGPDGTHYSVHSLNELQKIPEVTSQPGLAVKAAPTKSKRACATKK